MLFLLRAFWLRMAVRAISRSRVSLRYSNNRWWRKTPSLRRLNLDQSALEVDHALTQWSLAVAGCVGAFHCDIIAASQMTSAKSRGFSAVRCLGGPPDPTIGPCGCRVRVRVRVRVVRVRVRVRTPCFGAWWHEAKTWEGDPLAGLGEQVLPERMTRPVPKVLKTSPRAEETPRNHAGSATCRRISRPFPFSLTDMARESTCRGPHRGSNSVVECNLAKVDVEGSNPFSRSAYFRMIPVT